MDKPSPRALREATGISQSYASMIVNGKRDPARPLAIRIMRMTGWRPAVLAGLSDAQIATLETIEPWTRSTKREGVAA